MPVSARDVEFVPLFKGVEPDDLQRILRFAAVDEFAAGRTLVTEGSRSGNLMYVVLSGEVDVSKRDRSGEDIHLTTLHEGEFFGELALFNRTVRTATAKARTAVKLLMLSRGNIDEMIHVEPAITAKVLFVFTETLAKRLQETTEQLAAAGQYRAEERMAVSV